MQHYIGLDVSAKVTAVCVMDSEGKILHEGQVPTDPEAIAIHLMVDFDLQPSPLSKICSPK